VSPTARRRLLALGLLGLLALVVAACVPGAAPTLAPGQTATPPPAASPFILKPAPLGADPVSVLAWLFTPIFQAFFLLLVGIDQVVPDIGIAIILTTVLVRTAMVPLMRRQMVSMRQLQAIQPEVKEIQRRYKNDRMKAQQAQSELMRERGISQAGCLVGMLPLLLLFPFYQVIREGLLAADLTQMVQVFGFKVLPISCPPPVPITNALGQVTGFQPCIDPHIPWLGGINAAGFEGVFSIPYIGFGISVFAILYTVIQLVASRMALPAHDPNIALDQNVRTQRAMSIWLPLITLLYSTIIPVGLFLYLIVSTIYQVVQQFLTTGWGGMFPLFGWTPGFARGHKPRFPVAVPTAPSSASRAAGAPAGPTPQRSALDRAASANATIRQRGRQGRRGRRR
jgi:YidC/Oxa1 family membrane protein insertase